MRCYSHLSDDELTGAAISCRSTSAPRCSTFCASISNSLVQKRGCDHGQCGACMRTLNAPRLL